LLDFRAGDAETGKGSGISHAVVTRFAEACPNIVHISLDGATNLTDESLLAILTNCPNLRYVQFSGNDKVHGRLRGPALDALRNRPEIGKHLIKMRLTDQREFDKQFDAAVRSLSAARRSLAIEVGNTSWKDGDVNTWIGGKKKYGYQAFDGPGGFDSYGGFGRPS
jgi:hypothetical protein